MKITLRVKYFLVENWWIDVSYNTHDDCMCHTGVIMSLGRGVCHQLFPEEEV